MFCFSEGVVLIAFFNWGTKDAHLMGSLGICISKYSLVNPSSLTIALQYTVTHMVILYLQLKISKNISQQHFDTLYIIT